MLVAVDGRVITHALTTRVPITIGRSSRCDVVIEHGSVSRHHTTLDPLARTITDAGSRNGTRVRGELVSPGEVAPVEPGEPIEVGDVSLTLHGPTGALGARPIDTGSCATEHRPLEVRLVEECARSARNGAPFTYARLHVAPPRTAVAREVLVESLRTSDVLSEPVPGQFQLLLPDLGDERALPVTRRLVQRLEAAGVAADAGIAVYPTDGITAVQLAARGAERLHGRGRAAAAMDPVRTLASQVAAGDVSVLFTGETGVGKELFAEQLHRLSPRRRRPFIKLNCAAIPETLLESELFGHARGAFTGAEQARAGLIEAADGGTLFLDEIGELALRLQATLLRVLEERLVRPVGATAARPIDVRFVYATNRSLPQEIEAGRFRQDLYYRISGVAIAIPPLRERRGELDHLAWSFAALARGRAGRAAATFTDEAMAAIRAHDWPGNVRELRNAVERAVLLAGDGAITARHLGLAVPAEGRAPGLEAPPPAPPPLAPAPTAAPAAEPAGRDTLPGHRLHDAIAALERARIVDALERCGGNQTRAARMLGVARNTLIARMEKFGLRRPQKD
ncbi:MAG: sigma 54-interacting transcriptional regulator [Myxococcales bacterium]|nr:sigma 54-interacting transcriptional regulator [Myxococcales bacterium]